MPNPDPVLARDWHPLAKVEDFARGGVVGSRLLGEDLVLWTSGGKYHAWKDLCVHRGSRLSLGKVTGGCLQCPYHGWTYDEAGKCVRIPAHPEQKPPARAVVSVYRCTEAYGWGWVCLRETPTALPVFPEWADATVRNFSMGPYEMEASGPRIIENFLDLAHLPVVHEGILGVGSRAEIGRYQVEKRPDGVYATEIVVWQPDP